MLKHCDGCDVEYPDELVTLFTSSEGCARLCGICALEATNSIHGISRTHFTAEIAEGLRRQALAWRKKLHAKV